MVRVISTALLRGVDYGADERADGWAYELDEPPAECVEQEPCLACRGNSRRKVRTVKPSPPPAPAVRVAVGKQTAQTRFAWEK